MDQKNSGSRGEWGEGRGTGEKERKGSSQGTGINDPWTWTIGCGLTVGAGMRTGQRRTMGEY